MICGRRVLIMKWLMMNVIEDKKIVFWLSAVAAAVLRHGEQAWSDEGK
jgi:hypothetical protein